MAVDFEELASGYGLIEGPTVAEDGSLIFSDVLKGGVYRLGLDGKVDTLVPKRRGVGGIAVHADGGLVLSGRDIVHVREGQSRVLLHADGAAGWNDLCVDAAGQIYAGLLRFAVFDPDAEEIPGECWHIDAEGSGRPVTKGIVHPNGIALSADGRTLYHADTRAGVVWVHDLDASGRAGNPRQFGSPGECHPDGLALDEAGGIWVAMLGEGRIDRFTPDGELDRSIDVPAKFVTSLCFGGEDMCDLIAVSADNARHPRRGGSVFRGRVGIPGARVYAARI